MAQVSTAAATPQDTCFFFSCGTDGFAGALQRFGAFFRAPLFTESATGREARGLAPAGTGGGGSGWG